MEREEELLLPFLPLNKTLPLLSLPLSLSPVSWHCRFSSFSLCHGNDSGGSSEGEGIPPDGVGALLSHVVQPLLPFLLQWSPRLPLPVPGGRVRLHPIPSSKVLETFREEFKIGSHTISIESGKIDRFANGSVVITMDETTCSPAVVHPCSGIGGASANHAMAAGEGADCVRGRGGWVRIDGRLQEEDAPEHHRNEAIEEGGTVIKF